MSTLPTDEIRRLVPLWRISSQINSSYEFSSLPSGKVPSSPNRSHLNAKLSNWNTNKSIGTAIDLYATARAVGDVEYANTAFSYLKTNSRKLPESIKVYLQREASLRTKQNAVSDVQIAGNLVPDLNRLAQERIVHSKKSWLTIQEMYLLTWIWHEHILYLVRPRNLK